MFFPSDQNFLVSKRSSVKKKHAGIQRWSVEASWREEGRKKGKKEKEEEEEEEKKGKREKGKEAEKRERSKMEEEGEKRME